MNFDEIQSRSREVFRLEAADLLAELEAALLELETDVTNGPAINRVFRAMHTLKGSGATSGFSALSDFLHHVEDVYNAAREGRVCLNSGLIDLTLKITDTVVQYLDAPIESSAAVLDAAQGNLQKLLSCLPSKHADSGAAAPAAAKDLRGWRILFHPCHAFFQSGSDPAMFLDDLRALGPCAITASLKELPALGQMNPELSYLGWEIKLDAPVSEADIRGVFAFVEDDCELEITRADPVTAASAAAPTQAAGAASWSCEFDTTAGMLAAPGLIETFWADVSKLGTHRILRSPDQIEGKPGPGHWHIEITTSASKDEIQDAFAFMIEANPRIVRADAAAAAVAEQSAADSKASERDQSAAQRETKAAQRQHEETLRVSSRKLDHLVNLVGELVILRSQLQAACNMIPDQPIALQSVGEGLQRLTSELRDVVLDIRMMPIGETFSKFKRLTRDMSQELGKDVDLVIEGAATEMDKSVLDQLNDPLVHLVRNCLDHGLESPDQRLKVGKPATGTLRLTAEQKGDRVLICVSDDGRGLNAEKIRSKAIAKNLIAADAVMSEAELYQLIFLPGFSTADVISKVSGRGVGLDVVKKRIEQLRGTVELDSRLGKGTSIRLSLPLTLAIIEGLMVGVDGDRYIMPLSAARETIEITKSQRESGNGRNVVEVRGVLIPYLRLRDLFAFTSDSPEVERVVIIEVEDKRIGLVVDQVLGNHQTVLKSLGWLGHRVQIFSGATVLGDGRAALILDIAGLMSFSNQRRGEPSSLSV